MSDFKGRAGEVAQLSAVDAKSPQGARGRRGNGKAGYSSGLRTKQADETTKAECGMKI